MQHLKPNTTLQGGKYRIERVLGQGGFGRVLMILFLIMSPVLVMAQASGGQIRRSTQSSNVIKRPSKSEQGKDRNTLKSEDILEKKYQKMSMISLEKYANQGDAMAQFYMGYNYAHRDDYENAVVWFRKAAFNDLIRAQLWLAYCYYHGKGCKVDVYGAKEWLKEAASRGSADAKEYLRTWPGFN